MGEWCAHGTMADAKESVVWTRGGEVWYRMDGGLLGCRVRWMFRRSRVRVSDCSVYRISHAPTSSRGSTATVTHAVLSLRCSLMLEMH
jgi:hypothetical protein